MVTVAADQVLLALALSPAAFAEVPVVRVIDTPPTAMLDVADTTVVPVVDELMTSRCS